MSAALITPAMEAVLALADWYPFPVACWHCE